MWEMFEDTKEVSRSRKLKKDIQYNGQKKNDKGRNDDPQNIIETEAKRRLITHIHDLSISWLGPGIWRYSTSFRSH
jgi:hypothetical protein